MENKITIRQSEFILRKFSCPEEISIWTFQKNEITAFIGPSGCGKVHIFKIVKPDE